MNQIVPIGTQTQGRTNDHFFEYRHIRSWESGVEDEWLQRNPGGWLQHRANVSSPPNHLYTSSPHDVDILANRWGKEEGWKWLAIRSDGRSISMRTLQGVFSNEDNIEAVYANWGYRSGGLWTDDEHKAIAWMFAHIQVSAAEGFLEIVPTGFWWCAGLSPNGYIADGLGPHGSFRPELSVWAAFAEPALRARLERLKGRFGFTHHTYGEIIRPGHPAWSDPAVRVLCPPELQREGGAYGGNRIEHALACRRLYGVLDGWDTCVGECNRQLEQDVALAQYPVPPDWPWYLALIKRYAPACPFTATQQTYNDRELCRWEWEATIRCVVSRYAEAKWGPWLWFLHLAEDASFTVLQAGDIPPVLSLKQVAVEEEVPPMPEFRLGFAELAERLRTEGHTVTPDDDEISIAGASLQKVTLDGAPNLFVWREQLEAIVAYPLGQSRHRHRRRRSGQ